MANADSRRLAVDVVARIDKFEREMKKMERSAASSIRNVETGAAGMSRKLAGLGVGAFAGLAAGATAALAPIALLQKTLATIDQASHLVETADKIGLTTTALQELTFGFSQAGVEAATFETSMAQFSKRIGEAATRGGNLAEILKANGVAIRDSNGEIRSAEELLRDYANLIAGAATEQERAVLANEAFGRSGADMVLALQGGAEAIDDMKRAAADAGGVIDEELLRKAEEVGDRFDAMWRRFEIRSQEAILASVDALDQLAKSFADFNEQRNAAAAGAMVGGMVDDPAPTMRDRLRSPIDSRIDQAFAGQPANEDAALGALLRKRFGRKTVVPIKDSGGGGRGAARDAVDPWAGLRKSAHDYSKALDDINERQRQMGEIGGNAVRATVDAFRDGKLEAEELLSIVADLAQQLLSLPTGGGSAGFLSFIPKLFGFEDGGIARNGKPVSGGRPMRKFAKGGISREAAIFGEAGTEAAVPLPDGRSIPVTLNAGKIPAREKSGGQSIVIHAPINAPGADAAALARVERSVRDLAKSIPAQVDQRTFERQDRKIRASS